MNRNHFLYNDYRMEGEDEEKEERPKSDSEIGMFNKKLERYFLKKELFISGALWMTKVQRIL